VPPPTVTSGFDLWPEKGHFDSSDMVIFSLGNNY